MPTKTKQVNVMISPEQIATLILLIRGQKIIIDADLASLEFDPLFWPHSDPQIGPTTCKKIIYYM